MLWEHFGSERHQYLPRLIAANVPIEAMTDIACVVGIILHKA